VAGEEGGLREADHRLAVHGVGLGPAEILPRQRGVPDAVQVVSGVAEEVPGDGLEPLSSVLLDEAETVHHPVGVAGVRRNDCLAPEAESLQLLVP
jgi:hypothetical protein